HLEAHPIALPRTPRAIVAPAGLGFALPPGVGLDVDLRGGIKPERAPRDGRDQKQDGCDEEAPKRAPARRERGIGHAAIPLTSNFVNKADLLAVIKSMDFHRSPAKPLEMSTNTLSES